ncbi:MAG TPA: carotenoid biosynthesis protein [bacterium]|nr:carotenoid biosynthesis protein [bacterium]
MNQEPTSQRQESITIWTIAVFLIVSTLFFTVLHLGYPHVLDVPSNEGVPYSDLPTMFILDLIPIGLAWLCFRHAWKRIGLYRAMIFLGGSFVFTGVEESMWILLGRYHAEIQAALGGPTAQTAVMGPGSASMQGTYYFTRGFFWFLETPVMACLGWFFVAYSCVYVANILLPRAWVLWRAGLGGLLAVNLDLWLDPVQTSATFKSWVWVSPDAINIFSIPLSNFIGWFLLIFLFALMFERLPAMEKKWGPARAAVYFYAILMALEIAILFFFAIYGTIAMRLIPEPVNFTIWGI